MILPAFIFVPHNTRSNFYNLANPSVPSCYVPFNRCCASLTPPFLPIIESLGITSLIAFLNEPKIIIIPSENVETYRQEVGAEPNVRLIASALTLQQ